MKIKKNKKELSNLNSQISTQKGFTLIELLVVIVLMSILMLTSVSVFFSYTKSQAFNTAVSDVVVILNKAKSRSISQIKPTDCDTATLEGYRVSFTPSGSDYQLNGLCNGSVYVIDDKLLPSGVTFDEMSADYVTFNSATGIVDIPVAIIIAGYGNSKTITVDAVGNILTQ